MKPMFTTRSPLRAVCLSDTVSAGITSIRLNHDESLSDSRNAFNTAFRDLAAKPFKNGAYYTA